MSDKGTPDIGKRDGRELLSDIRAIGGRDRPLCSATSRSAGEDPVGTAASHEAYFMLEVPPPWPAQAADSKHVPEGVRDALARAAALGRDVRFLAFASDDRPSPPGFRRAIVYRRPKGAFARYATSEFLVPERELTALAEAAVLAPERLDAFAAYADGPAAETRDLFVCTHGGRDVCCGTLGHPLYRLLEERCAAPSGGTLRVWRVSHLGGHRFAPTMADFPEGRYWAYMEPDDALKIARREGPFSEVYRNYRGWGGVGKAAQVLEREIMLREGWRWAEYRKSGAVVGEDADGVRVRIAYASADGTASGAYEGVVAETCRVATGGCGAEAKDVPQYRAVIVSQA